MSKKKNKDIHVSFTDDMASMNVTGSCTYVETPETNLLLECGMFQGSSLKTNYKINNRRFKFKVKKLDYVICGHFHSDHFGLIPRLVKEGFNGKIIFPTGSREIVKEMWLDAAYINQKDCESLNRKFQGREFMPLYTNADVFKALDLIEECPFNQKIKINDFELEFLHSGHIINSASIMLYFNGGKKKIYYTSDIGSEITTSYFTEPLEKIDNATLVISEATYSGKKRIINKGDKEKDVEKMDTIINDVLQNKGKILIPAFSLNRTQDILMFLHENGFIDKIDVYVDSPLSQRISKIYRKQYPFFNEVADKVTWIKESTDSKLLKGIKKPMIIISASGMCEAGRIISHLQNNIGKRKNYVVFCGFSANNTLASKIREKKNKTVTIFGKVYNNNAKVVEMRSFSSHIQKKELLKYLSSINCERIVLKHSEEDSKHFFANELREELENKCSSAKVTCCNKSLKINL